MRSLYVSTPRYTGRVDVCGGRVVNTPPVMRWMRGKRSRFVLRYLRSKGGLRVRRLR